MKCRPPGPALLLLLSLTAPSLTAAQPAPPSPVVDPDAVAPLAGYDGKNLFLRDRHDWFVLFPKGRVQVDWYNLLNRPAPAAGVVPNSAQDSRASLRDTVFIRRARLDLAGTVARHLDFRIEAEFASLATAGQYATITDAIPPTVTTRSTPSRSAPTCGSPATRASPPTTRSTTSAPAIRAPPPRWKRKTSSSSNTSTSCSSACR